jgi:serine/threonine protein kinase
MHSHVYLADDPQLGGEIAVKEIDKVNFGTSVSDYFNEAQVMFQVDHQNVVPILCAFQTADKICLAMRFFKNGSLRNRTVNGPLALKEVTKLGQGVLSGLISIHLKNLIHFDIKPSNIFYSDSGVPMVADFGQSRVAGPMGIASRPGMYLDGIPPECYSGVGSFQSDVYQTALTLYRAANGDAFFDSQRSTDPLEVETRTLAGEFPRRDKFLPHVPKLLRTVIRKALSLDPADRYQTASDFADALGKVDIKTDWQTTAHPGGNLLWTGKKIGKPRLEIELIRSGNKCDVQFHKCGKKKLQMQRNTLWKTGLTERQAFHHLKSYFDSAA